MSEASTPGIHRTMTAGEWAALLGLSVLWGGSFFFNGVAVKELPPLTLVMLRLGLAALILLAVLRMTGVRMPRGAAMAAAFLGAGLLNNVVPFCLIVWGQTQIASSLAAILNATTPLFTVVVAHLFTTDEKMTGNRLVGVVAGLVGVVVMVGPAALAGIGTSLGAGGAGGGGTSLAPQLACLGAALSYAFGGVYARRFSRMGVPPLATATGQVTASWLMLCPVALVVDRPWTLPVPSLGAAGAILAIAAFSTALAYVVYFRLLASAGATNLALVTFLVPVSAIVLGAGLLGERLAPRQVAGMALIGAGLAAIDGRLLRRVARGRAQKPAGLS